MVMIDIKTVSQNLKLKKIILLSVPLFLSSCGLSVGSAAFGTTEFMQQHNHKVSLMLRQSEEAGEPVARSWQK